MTNMDKNTKYETVLETLKETAEKRERAGLYTAMGFSSNLDLLLDFQVEKLNELLQEHMPGMLPEEARPFSPVRTRDELLQTIVYFCIHGIGGEADITDPSLVKDHFVCTNAMGGTATQAAMALSKVGGHTVVHLTDDSREVCEQLDSPYIHLAHEDGHLCRAGEVESHNPQEIHFILQFKKGDRIRTGGKSVSIPCSNRLILTKNTVNESLPFWEPYFRWIEEHARQVTSNVLSSFNAIQDPELLKERLERVKTHVELYHERNPEGIIYFEDAHYHNAEIRRICMDTLYPYVDIMSMNEEELQYTLEKMYRYPVDLENVISCAEGAEFLKNEYRVRKGIVIHTKDYAMFVGDPGKAQIENGLMFGSVMATAKAEYGGYGGEKEIGEILRLPLSEQGLRYAEILEKSDWKGRAFLVPTRYIDKPKYTIGLGDSFTGGMQLCFGCE